MQRGKKRIAGDRPDKNIKELRLENQGSRHQSDDARLPFYINIQDVYMKKGKFPYAKGGKWGMIRATMKEIPPSAEGEP